MTRVALILTNFSGGELSERLDGRVDLAKYRDGCRTMRNMLPLVYGGATRRPGTRYLGAAKTPVTLVRLIPFVYSTLQAYVIEAGDGYFRFWANGGLLVDGGGSPVEVATPYTVADLRELQFVQSADTLWIVHPSYAPRKLTRTSATAFSVTAAPIKNGPFLPQNDGGPTVLASGATGNVTLVASADLFLSGHVGALWQLKEAAPGLPYATWAPSQVVATGDVRRYAGNVYRATNGGTTGNTPPTHEAGTVSDGTVTWAYMHDGTGVVQITGVSNAMNATATVVQNEIPASAVGSPTSRWAEGAWSDVRGYPGCVAFYEQRLYYARSTYQPQTVWASVSADFDNFAQGTADDDGVTYTLATDDVQVIRALSPGKVLTVLTQSGEFIAQSGASSEPITPLNIKVSRETTYGSAPGLRAIRIGNAVVHVQRGGRRVRELGYEFQSDSFVSSDLTLLAEHITAGGVVDMAWAQEPDGVLWVARGDGTLLGLTYDRGQKVVAWHRHDLGGGGTVEALTTIPGPSGDEVWMVVRRTIGATVRYVERLTPVFDQTTDPRAAVFVDCSLQYSGSPATVISGLAHLNGQTVSVLADGAAHPDVVVTGGAITLQAPASTAQVGLGYTSDLQTMRLDAPADDGTGQGRLKRISRVVVRLFRSANFYFGLSESRLDVVPLRTTDDPMGLAVSLKTTDVEITPPAGWEREGRLWFRQAQPLPLTVLAVMPRVNVSAST